MRYRRKDGNPRCTTPADAHQKIMGCLKLHTTNMSRPQDRSNWHQAPGGQLFQDYPLSFYSSAVKSLHCTYASNNCDSTSCRNIHYRPTPLFPAHTTNKLLLNKSYHQTSSSAYQKLPIVSLKLKTNQPSDIPLVDKLSHCSLKYSSAVVDYVLLEG